jgi:hypothetical protein
MEPITRTELQDLYPEQLRRQRDRLVDKMSDEVYRTVKRLAAVGLYEYKHTAFGDEKDILPFVMKKLREVLIGIDICLESTFYKDRNTQRMIEVKDSAIRIVWD